MKKDVTVSVEASAYDLGNGVRNFIKVVDQQLKDGFSLGQDVPPILMAAYSDLFSQAAAISQLGPDLKEDKFAFIRAWALVGVDVAEDLSK